MNNPLPGADSEPTADEIEAKVERIEAAVEKRLEGAAERIEAAETGARVNEDELDTAIEELRDGERDVNFYQEHWVLTFLIVFPLTFLSNAVSSLTQTTLNITYNGLSKKNFDLDSGFYPLGSCTMKYNPKVNELTARLPGFANLHPYQSERTVQGALALMHELESPGVL